MGKLYKLGDKTIMKCKIAYLDKNRTAKNEQHRVAGPSTVFFWNVDSMIRDLGMFKPDLVFINKGDRFNNPEFIEHITSTYRTAYWFGDWRKVMPEYMFNWASRCGVAFFNVNNEVLWKKLEDYGQKNIFNILHIV